MIKKNVMMVSVLLLSVLLATPIVAQGAAEYVQSVESVIDPDSSGVVAESGPASGEEGILLMREEEKLARDVYVALHEKWGIRTFANIARSEQRHMDAVAALMQAKGIADPVAHSPAGQFTHATIASLYKELVTLGMKSPIDALIVGAIIEDLDIADLERLLADTDDPDTVRVYSALLRGSENHMRSFAGLLERNGTSYEARHISSERLAEILNSR